MKKISWNFVLILLLLICVVFSLPTASVKAQDATPEYQIAVVDNQLEWITGWNNKGFQLTIVFPGGNDFINTFTAEEVPVFSLLNSNGISLPDGLYKFHLVGVPELVLDNLDQVIADREAGLVTPIADQELQIWTGSFSISKGSILVPQSTINSADTDSETKDIVQLDDVIVDGSLCVGLDCVNGESFGFDTIRLKENNLRIKFQDTSSASSFPTNDWQITINDSADGGSSYFAIEDIDHGNKPFLIEAGAGANALYIDDYGRVGLGTNAPVVELHIYDNDTPAVRLDQNGSSGWTPQIWDVAGNEANFFIRDVTHGSNLPFRIKPGAPYNSLYISENGYVGFGTNSPEAKLHVAGDAVLEGYLSERSDVFAKENFRMVSGAEILNQLTEIPISVWNYKDDQSKTSHMGPMAQDFYAAFGLGKDDTHIAALDVNGVALASIQELSRTLKEKDTEIQALNEKVDNLEARMEKLEDSQISKQTVNRVLPLLFGIAGLATGALIIKKRS